MLSRLNVLTPATVTRLTTLASLKADLGVTDNGSDDRITELLDQVTGEVVDLIGPATSEEWTKTLASEKVIETFFLREYTTSLWLGRWPVREVHAVAISSVTGTVQTLATDEYEVRKAWGIINPMCGIMPKPWMPGTVAVTYTAGWIMPETEGFDRDLPVNIENAAKTLGRYRWSGLLRDIAIKAEAVPEVYSVTYANDAAETQVALEKALDRLLGPFVQRRIVY